MKPREAFDRLHHATLRSEAYREAVRESAAGLPEWVMPFSAIDRALLERIACALRVCASDTFLDFGCGSGGPGLWIADYTGADVIGVDIATSAIAEAQALAESRGMSSRARFIVAPASNTGILDASPSNTGLPDASIAAATSIDVLIFLDAHVAAQELARVVRPGGRFVATAAETVGEPFAPLLQRDYRPILEDAGFRIVSHGEAPGHAERQLVLYRALKARADRLRAEMGEPAEWLLEEAENGLNRAANGTIRVRHALIVAERIPQKIARVATGFVILSEVEGPYASGFTNGTGVSAFTVPPSSRY